MFESIVRKCCSALKRYKLWIVVIAIWIVGGLLMFFLAPSLSSVGEMNEASFLPKDSQYMQAQEILQQKFPDQVSQGQGLLVFYNPQSLTDSDFAYAKTLSLWLVSPAVSPPVERVTSFLDNPDLKGVLLSQDGQAMMMPVDFSGSSYDTITLDAVGSIRARIAADRPSGLTVYLTGGAAIGKDMFAAVTESTNATTIATVLLVVLVLLLVYRSPVAMLVPLLTVALAALVARGLLGFLATGGLELASMMDAMVIVLVFGAGTDYVLFMISRFREELGHHKDQTEAIATTVTRIGPVITASAGTVIIGLLGMMVAQFGMIRTNGPAMALSILIALIAAWTLTPSLLFLFGRALFWPFHRKLAGTVPTKGLINWEKVGNLVTRRPWLVAGIVLVLLLAPYPFWFGMNSTFDVMAEIPNRMESAQGFALLKNHFPGGEIAPLTVVLTSTGSGWLEPKSLQRLAEISQALAGVEGIASVRNALQPTSTSSLAAFRVDTQLQTMTASMQEMLASLGQPGQIQSLLTQNPTSGLDALKNYLNELSAKFPQAAGNPALASALSSLEDLSGQLAGLIDQTKVDVQLQKMVAEMEAFAAGLTDPAQLPSLLGSFDRLSVLGGYLTELGTAFPSLAADPSYLGALGALANLQQGASTIGGLDLTDPAQIQRAIQGLQQPMALLLENLRGLARSFAGTGRVFLPSSQATAGTTGTPSTVLLTVANVRDQLAALSTTFQAEPAFLIPQSFLTQQPQLQELLDRFFSTDRSATQMTLILRGDPYGFQALETVDRVRAELDAQTALMNRVLGSGYQTYLSGTTVMSNEAKHTVDADFTKVQIVVVAGVLLVFILLLRSLLAPIYLALSVILSYGTTMGICTLIFQNALGYSGVNYALPIIVFVLLVALGADYNIFLMSRVREEAKRAGDIREGIRRATAFTGSVITSCGIILAGTFAALIFSPINMLMQIGTAVAIGVLVDTFIVRTLLVPAIATILGRWNWWPSRK